MGITSVVQPGTGTSRATATARGMGTSPEMETGVVAAAMVTAISDSPIPLSATASDRPAMTRITVVPVPAMKRLANARAGQPGKIASLAQIVALVNATRSRTLACKFWASVRKKELHAAAAASAAP